MGVITTTVMVGMAVAGGAMAYSASRTAEKRANAQAKISEAQGNLELRRASNKAEEAMRDLESAKEYQQWKDDFVVPVLERSISNPRQSDPAQLRASKNLAAGIEAEAAHSVIAKGISGAGFNVGGSRHAAADDEIQGKAGALSVATMGATHEAVRQQGVSNTGAMVNAGRQVYKQQGII